MSDLALYLRAAQDLRRNPGQLEAYNSTGHCAVLAGPGSGKTKVLTIKLARMLAEDIAEPRGIACITYNNECAKELELRLDALGVDSRGRLFIGTVHSFALTQIVLPYARTAGLNLPDHFRVATQAQQRGAFQRAFDRVIGGRGDPEGWRLPMDRYRRSILDRGSDEWRLTNPDNAQLVEAYEEELRAQELIDFDDMPLLAIQALKRHEWLRRAILAKYPVLVVDEYQDLGLALHAMVMGLCFSTGIRLFAVGDVDQSIYGFTGARPELLQRIARRGDVETVQLRFNYRCASRIVTASEYALGEERGYEAADGAVEGSIYFHSGNGGYEGQAYRLFSTVLPGAFERISELTPGQIAILYPAAWIGDSVADEAERHGFEIIRTDRNAPYPRGSPLMRWLELCAVWCCGGWRIGRPRFSRIVAEANRIFAEALTVDDERLAFQRQLLAVSWALRDGMLEVHDWFTQVRDSALQTLVGRCRTVDEDWVVLSTFIERTGIEGDLAGMTLGQFSGFGIGSDRLNLSTLHSAKSREFELVILFGMDDGRIPRSGATGPEVSEARRLFYVGFTRAKRELHIMFSEEKPSPFVTEVWERLQQS